jgi:hypothetical protein
MEVQLEDRSTESWFEAELAFVELKSRFDDV